MNLFKLINLLPEAVQKGKAVSNPEAWKKGQVTSNALAAFLTAVLGVSQALGYEIPLSAEQLNYVAGGLLSTYGLYNVVATVVTTEKVGVTKN